MTCVQNNGSACSDDDGDTTPAWSSNSPTSDVSSPELTVSSESELAYYFDGDGVLSFDESKVMMNAASSSMRAEVAAACVLQTPTTNKGTYVILQAT